MNQMTNVLIMLSDILDSVGLYKEAADIDKIVEDRWSEAGKIPQYQFDMSWKEAFNYLKQNLDAEYLQISEDSMQRLHNTINRVIEEISTKADTGGLGERTQSADQVHYLPPEFVTLAENIANLQEDIRKSNEMLLAEGISEEDAFIQKKNIEADTQAFKENVKVLDLKSTQKQREIVKEYINSINTGRKVLLLPERRNQTERRK